MKNILKSQFDTKFKKYWDNKLKEFILHHKDKEWDSKEIEYLLIE